MVLKVVRASEADRSINYRHMALLTGIFLFVVLAPLIYCINFCNVGFVREGWGGGGGGGGRAAYGFILPEEIHLRE